MQLDSLPNSLDFFKTKRSRPLCCQTLFWNSGHVIPGSSHRQDRETAQLGCGHSFARGDMIWRWLGFRFCMGCWDRSGDGNCMKWIARKSNHGEEAAYHSKSAPLVCAIDVIDRQLCIRSSFLVWNRFLEIFAILD